MNVDLKTDRGAEFIAFMRDTFNLELNNDPAITTTRNNTCIDAFFTRHVGHVQTKDYISYFCITNRYSVLPMEDNLHRRDSHICIMISLELINWMFLWTANNPHLLFFGGQKIKNL